MSAPRTSGLLPLLPKPFNAADIDLLLHDIHGLRSPNLQLRSAEREFEVAIQGSTIRLVHNGSGDVFEYLWFKQAPHLRNPTIRQSPAENINRARLAAIAENAALNQLSFGQGCSPLSGQPFAINKKGSALRAPFHLKAHSG